MEPAILLSLHIQLHLSAFEQTRLHLRVNLFQWNLRLNDVILQWIIPASSSKSKSFFRIKG